MLEVLNYSENELKKMFLKKDQNGRTAFVIAALNNTKEICDRNRYGKLKFHSVNSNKYV